MSFVENGEYPWKFQHFHFRFLKVGWKLWVLVVVVWVTWLSSKCPNKGLLQNATYPMTPLKTKQFFLIFWNCSQKFKELITKLLLCEVVIVICSGLASIFNTTVHNSLLTLLWRWQQQQLGGGGAKSQPEGPQTRSWGPAARRAPKLVVINNSWQK